MEENHPAKQKPYPIGIQSFPKLIENNFEYVDKTAFVAKITSVPGYYFLSRPRRFGKSLLLSTIHAYFEGKRSLFKGLIIDSMDVDWLPRPVIHFDFNAENYAQPCGLDYIIDGILHTYEEKYGVVNNSLSYARRLEKIIKVAFNITGRRVVILVDEYDKPLLGVEDNRELFEKNQATLKAMFGVMKSLDEYIQFGMLTGVARFAKVSIFSDLNNLQDISLDEEASEACGLTEDEVKDHFRIGIENLARSSGKDFKDMIKELRGYYDGYCFSRNGKRLYNPLSIMRALKSGRMECYWFETGTPTFLVKRIKESNMSLPSLNRQWCTESQLLQVGLDSTNPVPLLFQTGYLSIVSFDSLTNRYELHFPNYEVEKGFAEKLLPLYIPKAIEPDSPFDMSSFQRDLIDGNPESFMERLKTLFKTIPYEQHSEKTCQNIVYLMCTLAGTDAAVERHTNVGRTDLEAQTSHYVYIFEFKYNKSVEEAMSQIHKKDYAGRYKFSQKEVFLIGANFSLTPSHRTIVGWKIEKWNN